MKTAIIDIGSNSVRLLVVNGEFSQKFVKITKLVKDMTNGRTLSIDSIKRTAEAVLFFVDFAKGLGIDDICIFATAAVRSADNKEDFTRLVKEKTGIIVDVISGELEGKLGHLGVYSGKDGGVIDIGGGSTEITVYNKGECIYSHSMPFGAVNLTNMFAQDSCKIKDFLSSEIKSFGDIPKSDYAVIGGTASNVVSVLLGLEKFDSTLVDGQIICKTEVANLLDTVAEMTVDDRKHIVGLQVERSVNFHAGLSILYLLFDYLKINEVRLSEKDNLEGYLFYKKGIL